MSASRAEEAGASRSAWLRGVRYAWLAVVLSVLAWLLASHGGDIARIASGYSGGYLAAAFACLILGKFLVLLQMQLSILAVGHRLPMHEAAYVYSSADASKYLPGGFWGLVGRAALYRVRGISARGVTLALLLENLWLVAGAFAVGAAFSYPALGGLLRKYSSVDLALHVPPLAMIAASIVALLVVDAAAFRFSGSGFSLQRLLQVVVLQCTTWVLLGASFALLAPTGRHEVFLSAIGGYALAFGASLVSVFAPAGLGVREAVVTALLHQALSIDVVVVMALANRLLSIGADVAFSLAALGWHAHSRVAHR